MYPTLNSMPKNLAARFGKKYPQMAKFPDSTLAEATARYVAALLAATRP